MASLHIAAHCSRLAPTLQRSAARRCNCRALCCSAQSSSTETQASRLPRRRAVALLAASSFALLPPTPRPAAAEDGVELLTAVRQTRVARDALRALAASPADESVLQAARDALSPLAAALPAVGAAAADFGRPASALDLSIAAFAFLDRGVDGASLK